MEIKKKINQLKNLINETDLLVEEMISSIEVHKIKADRKEKKISELKAEVRDNLEQIEDIIKEYNANS